MRPLLPIFVALAAASPLAAIARSVVLELSQGTVLGAPDGVLGRLRELRRLGFTSAVD